MAGMNDSGRGADSVVELELGFERSQASTIVEACRAEGYDVERSQLDSHGLAPGPAPLAPHRLLAREADLDALTEIVNRSFPQTKQDTEPLSSAQGRHHARIVVVFAVALLVMIVVSLGQHDDHPG